MRRIGIMIGSDSDLPQCKTGLEYLDRLEDEGKVDVGPIITCSIHRNTQKVLDILDQVTERVDVWIIGAGWANHLTGIADSFLRYGMKNDLVPVIGVAFDSGDARKNSAAILSITEVPGTQVIFDGKIGQEGFMSACQKAALGEWPKIVLKEPKPYQIRSLSEILWNYKHRKEE